MRYQTKRNNGRGWATEEEKKKTTDLIGDKQSGPTELLLDLRETRQQEQLCETGWENCYKIQSEWKHDGSSSSPSVLTPELCFLATSPHGHHLRPRFGRLPEYPRRGFSRVASSCSNVSGGVGRLRVK